MDFDINSNLELRALKSFRDSINNSLKDYLYESIEILLGGMESTDVAVYSTEEKVKMLTHMIVLSLQWRYEFELHTQYAKMRIND